MSDLLREEFEAWFSVNAPDINNLAAARVAKHMMIKELAFLTWQASRECLVVELPIPVDFPDGTGDYHQMIDPDDLIDAIHAAGVKTK